MLCQNCHKNLASIRYAEVVDGEVKDLHLCKDCMDERENSAQTGFEFSTPAPFLGKQNPAEESESAVETAICRDCSTELRSIRESGKVGCSTCYDAFPAELESVLEGIHVGLTHKGKIPRMDDARARVRADLQTKRSLLKTALSTENYEEAAALRDEIRALESGLGASEGGVD